MKKLKPLLFILIIFSSCSLFLGPDPDLSDENVLYNLWKDFNEIHAYINVRMDINNEFDTWRDVYKYYHKELTSGKLDLFGACSGLLSELGDPHVSLYATGGYFYTFDNSLYTYRRNTSFKY